MPILFNSILSFCVLFLGTYYVFRSLLRVTTMGFQRHGGPGLILVLVVGKWHSMLLLLKLILMLQFI
jgi:hypothetical protein